MKLMLFVVAVLLVAAGYNGVVDAQYSQQHGQLVGEVQALKEARDQVNAQWTQLLIEQKMLADDSVVSHAVQAGMKMHLPGAEQVVYLD